MSLPANVVDAAQLVMMAFGLAQPTADNPPAPGRGGAAVQNVSRPPNIVLIVADDLGYGDLGSFGATKIRTPTLDRMAAEGVKLTQFYVTASLCTPSRAALLTGRHQIRSGLTQVLFPDSKDGIDANELTLAEALKARGYRTACIGKWHLGHLPPYLPTRHGFDEYLGIPYSNDMDSPARKDPPVPLMRNEQIIEQPVVQETLTERYTAEAIRFIRDGRAPFFLYLPHTFPHVPLYVSDRFRGRSAGGLYGDVVETIDWSTAEILRTLRELGLDRDTLVVFTSDNGPWLIKGDHAGTAGPLREGKQTVYEGGIRVPFIARWPDRIPAGRTIDTPAISLDLFPTLLALAGGGLPVDRPLDGENIAPLLLGTADTRAGQEFFFYQGGRLAAMRWGAWKLHLRQAKDGTRQTPELYNLVLDAGEREDRAAQQPVLVAALAERAAQFDAEARKRAAPPKR